MTRHHERPRPSSVGWLIIAIALALLVCATSSGEARPGYPKVANMFLSNGVTAADITELSRWDMLILDVDFPLANPGVLDQLHTLHPGIKIYAYIPINGTFPDGSGLDPGSVLRRYSQACVDNDFWLRSVDGTPVSDWPNKWSTNITAFSNRDPQGETYPVWFAHFVYDNVWQQGASRWDGIFLDDVWDDISWLNNLIASPIDADRDGVADDPDSLDAWWREGNAACVATLRSLTGPSVDIIGNGSNTIYNDLNGTMIENFPYNGAPDQNNAYGYAWTKKMFTASGSYFNVLADYTNVPALDIVVNSFWDQGSNAAPDTSGRFAAHKRLMLASTLLGDGYFSFDYTSIDHASLWWLPEYDFFLGDPLGPAYSYLVGGQTVWRRDFTAASVVVNPNNQPLAAQAGLPDIGDWDAYIGAPIVDPPPPDTTAPAEIVSYWGWPNSATSVTLKWWSVGDDGMTGRADHYLIRHGPGSMLVPGAWEAGTPVANSIVPTWPGIPETLSIGGLQPATVYYFAVKAVDEAGNAGPVQNFNFRLGTLTVDPPGGDTTPPRAITTLALETSDWDSADLTWISTGDDDNLGQAALYDGRYATFPIDDGNWNTAAVIPGLAPPEPAVSREFATLAGLAPQTTYYVSLKCEDNAGNISPLGNVLSFTTAAVPDTVPPPVVADLAVIDSTASGLTLGFTAPGDGGQPIIAYEMRYLAGSAFPASAWNSGHPVTTIPPQNAGAAVRWDVSGLAPGTTYVFRMRSRDVSWNNSELSNLAVGTTRTGNPPPPGDTEGPNPVTDLAVQQAGLTAVVLGFTAPADAAGTVVSYDLRYVPGNVFADAEWGTATAVPTGTPSSPGTVESVTAGSLSAATTYSFRLRSTDDAGNPSTLGNTVTVTTASPPPPPPPPGDTLGPDPVTDLAVATVGVTSAILTFTAPADSGGTVASYDLRYTEGATLSEAAWSGATGVPTGTPGAPGATESVTAVGLSGGTTYSFRLLAVDDSDNPGALGNTVTLTTATPPPPPPPPPTDTTGPAVITDLQAIPAGPGALDLTFTEPADAEGVVASLMLRYVAGATFAEGAWDAATPVTLPAPAGPGTPVAVTVTDLADGTSYSFRARAVDDAGNPSALSPVTSATTEMPPPPPPPPPPADTTGPAIVTDLSVTALGETWVDLAFTAPADSAGTVVAYDLRFVPGTLFEDAAWDTATVVPSGVPLAPGASESLRVEGLEAGADYTFRLRARDDADNWSAPGNAAWGRTPVPPPPPDVTPPPPVADLAARVDSANGVHLTWTSVGDGPDLRRLAGRELRWRLDAIDAATWSAGVVVDGLGSPGVPGAKDSVLVEGLPVPAQIAFAMVVSDSAGNVSTLGNVETVTLKKPPEPPDTTPPLPVVGLTAELEGDAVAVRWHDSPAPDLSHYRIYRSRSAMGSLRLYRDHLAAVDFVDSHVVPGREYVYAVTAVDADDNESALSPSFPIQIPRTFQVERPIDFFSAGLPSPNPSAGPVALTLEVGSATGVTVEVYDVAGRRLTRFDPGTVTAGSTTVRWDGRDASGRRVSRGIYWIRVHTDLGNRVRRVLIVR